MAVTVIAIDTAVADGYEVQASGADQGYLDSLVNASPSPGVGQPMAWALGGGVYRLTFAAAKVIGVATD